MPRTPQLVSAVTVALLTLGTTAACGGSDEPKAVPKTTATTPAPTEAPPAYALLSKADLEKTLLGVADMPVGYSQDPPTADTSKTFCDYKEPFKATIEVSHDFTKSGGVSTEIASVGFRQYKDSQQAAAAFKALVNALGTCKSENYQGEKLTYSQMSTPKVGDGTIGVRIETSSVTLLQNFALVGPTLINAGSGGLTNADANEAAKLLTDQVTRYESAAKK